MALPLIEPLLPDLAAWVEFKDAKSRLQEWSQAELRATPRYQTADAEGPDHAKIFTVQVIINDQVYGSGQGNSKQRASQAAAADALHKIEAA
jgi:ribonuclease-3